MATKNKYKAKESPGFNKSRGRKPADAGTTSQQTKGREKNVGHKKSEEHSIKPKGNKPAKTSR